MKPVSSAMHFAFKQLDASPEVDLIPKIIEPINPTTNIQEVIPQDKTDQESTVVPEIPSPAPEITKTNPTTIPVPPSQKSSQCIFTAKVPEHLKGRTRLTSSKIFCRRDS